jgi:hypothetical protein
MGCTRWRTRSAVSGSRKKFRIGLRAAIDEHLALLDLRKQENADSESLRFLRRRSTTDVG